MASDPIHLWASRSRLNPHAWEKAINRNQRQKISGDEAT
jgi:hypothetical protein